MEYGKWNMGAHRKPLRSTFYIQHSRSGFSLVEVILSAALFGLIVTIFVGAYLYGQESTALAGSRARAVMLASEGIEAVRNIRDEDYANLIDGTFGLTESGGQWVFSGSSDLTDIFSRSITITTVDEDRKSITSNVAWTQNTQRSGSVSLITRLTNWMQAGLSWANPGLVGSVNMSGGNNGKKVQISDNYAYVVRAGGTDFIVIDISTPSSPSVVGSLSLTGAPANIFVLGSYAYVTSNDNSSELIIIDISTPSSPSVVGGFNNAGGQNGTGVYVNGNTAYVGFNGNDELSLIDVSTPSLPVLISTLNLSGDVTELLVSGDYVYIASESNNSELQIVDVSSPTSPSLVTTLDLASNSNADTIAMQDNTLYVGQDDILHIIDVSTPASPAILGTYDAEDRILDIALNFGEEGAFAFLASRHNDRELQVVDISTPTAPVLFGSGDTDGSTSQNGVAYDITLDLAIVVGDDNNEEAAIFIAQ